MTERDSRDAWAGIVEFDGEEPDAQHTEAKAVSSSLLNADIQTDVDTLPGSDTNHDQVPTQESSIPQRTPDGGPQALSLRSRPIREKGANETDTPASRPTLPDRPAAIAAPRPQTPHAKHDSLTDLEDVSPKTWDPKVNATWADYRQVITILSAGVVTIALILFFKAQETTTDTSESGMVAPTKVSPNERLEKRESVRAGQFASTPPSSKNASVKSKAPVAKPKPKPAVAEPTPVKTEVAEETSPRPTEVKAIPMLSILSVPLGALVEIEGKVYGKTPLIRMSPQTSGALEIKLKHKLYKTTEATIRPNENGHYEIQVKMELRD